jgi:hypothetical protein
MPLGHWDQESDNRHLQESTRALAGLYLAEFFKSVGKNCAASDLQLAGPICNKNPVKALSAISIRLKGHSENPWKSHRLYRMEQLNASQLMMVLAYLHPLGGPYLDHSLIYYNLSEAIEPRHCVSVTIVLLEVYFTNFSQYFTNLIPFLSLSLSLSLPIANLKILPNFYHFSIF